jgi:hypothetical protein
VVAGTKSGQAGFSFLKRYQELLNTAPLQTKLVTSFFIYALSETSAQLLTNNTAKHAQGGKVTGLNRVRWREVFGYACLAFYNAPMMHNFFSLTADLSVSARVVTTLLIVDPCNTAASLLHSSLMKGKTFSEALACVRQRFIPAMKMVLTVSPMVHIVNNLFMPLQFRVLFNNCAALGVTTYLCLTTQN